MLRPRPFLLDIPPYKLGESSVPGMARVIVLASNECAADPSPLAIAAYRAHAGRLRRYADGATTELRAAIGACHGLDAARIVCGNGSEELIGLLVRAYAGPGDEVLHSEHGYALFALSARISGATPTAVPERDLVCEVDALLARVTSRTRLVLLANPNNPTGSCLAAGEVERLRRALPDDVLLVLDAAYAEYVMRADYEPGARLVEAYDNVVMLRTFSKIYGLASLRLGWAYCPRGVADVLHRTRPPSNVSGPAQAAAIAALADQAHVAQNYAENARWRAWFTAEIARLGLKPYRSEGNFVLVRFGGGPQRAADAYAFLKSRGIIARPMAAYRLDDCLRFTIGTG
ncbi:MAG: aminotransferase class I/II-fold pyridoxal phosphate-dependent enzyme, partial [Proteobacteria bacterium]|nr:aminotransferase class I/II-fold pyridoxal phosphate-dependent enzyme [Pseudomonadota bacterium]